MFAWLVVGLLTGLPVLLNEPFLAFLFGAVQFTAIFFFMVFTFVYTQYLSTLLRRQGPIHPADVQTAQLLTRFVLGFLM
jgi:hypothetical protein